MPHGVLRSKRTASWRIVTAALQMRYFR